METQDLVNYILRTGQKGYKNMDDGQRISNEMTRLVEECINQEVERRIVARQLTDEEIENNFTTPHYHYEKGHYYKVRKDRIFGAKWYRSRLMGKLNNSKSW